MQNKVMRMEYSLLEHYLKTGKYHPSTPDAKKRGIRKASHNYLMKDDALIYVGKGRMQLVCRSDADKKRAIAWCHNNRPNNLPCNVKDTIKMLQKSFYWHGLNKDIEKRLFSCDVCKPMLMPDSRLADIQPLPVSLLQRFNPDSVDIKPPVFPITRPAITANAIEDRFREEELSDDMDGSENGFHIPGPRSNEEYVSTLPESPQQRTIELLLERVTYLESFNSELLTENEMLKDKVDSLHSVLENQTYIPLLKDLVHQLREIVPQATRAASSKV